MTAHQNESGLTFLLPEDRLLNLDATVATICNGKNHFPSVDFLIFRQGASSTEWIMMLIEAKSSAPNPTNPKSRQQVNWFLRELSEKFRYSLALAAAMSLEAHPTIVRPRTHNRRQMPSPGNWHLILVISGDFKTAWCNLWADKLASHLKSTLRAWGLSRSSVQVLNKELARKVGLIA